MKILTVVGARPQFVKAAALSRAFSNYAEIQEKIVHTGQHYDENMSEIFFREMDIPTPHYHLNINGLSHGAMTGQMLEGIEKIIQTEVPDIVLVYGDTNSTLAGALAAKKLHIQVAHVEAGLRSFNNKMPEEINRILTDRISDYLFCPTKAAVDNLNKEGFKNFDCQIVKTGDVMEDAAMYYAKKAAAKSSIIQNLKLQDSRFILATIHRAENTDVPERLSQIIKVLEEVNQRYPVVMPIHPRTRKILQQQNIAPSFMMIDPVGYFDMIMLLKNCHIVLTDSGGLQKEAYFFNKFCITLREQTEWVELVEHGYNALAGKDFNSISTEVEEFSKKEFIKKSKLYGGGKATIRIADFIVNQAR